MLDKSHHLYEKIMSQLSDSRTAVDDISLAGKLVALRQLLLDCGFGTTELEVWRYRSHNVNCVTG